MGGCCSCLSPKKSDLSPASSPTHQSGYGTIKSGVPGPPKETERLVASGPPPPGRAVPKIDVKPPEQTEQSSNTEKRQRKTKQKAVVEKEVRFKEEEGKKLTGSERSGLSSDRTSSLSEGTAGEETASENESSALVANAKNRQREKELKGKKGKHGGYAVVSKVSKTAGKMKKAITGKEKETPKKQANLDVQQRGSSGFERVPSWKMKSKYAREKLEKLEKDREVKERQKHHSGGFRDPRKAAIERGQKISELEDATARMNSSAQGFAQTAERLAKAKKK